MKYILILFLLLSTSTFAGDLIVIGKGLEPEQLNHHCATIYIGSNQDMDKIMGQHFNWCSFRAHDTCFFLYKNGDRKLRQTAINACSQIEGDHINNAAAEKLSSVLEQLNIPITEEEAKYNGFEVLRLLGI